MKRSGEKVVGEGKCVGCRWIRGVAIPTGV